MESRPPLRQEHRYIPTTRSTEISLKSKYERRWRAVPNNILSRCQRRWPTVIGLTVLVMTGWAAFLTYVTNETKVTSSVVKQILRTIKSDSRLEDTLGLAIRPQPEWWLNGYPIIHGQVGQISAS
jgi:cytochrome c oxidase assembly factor 1